MGSTQLSPIWLRLVGPPKPATGTVALGTPALPCPPPERTMTRVHWVERSPNQQTIRATSYLPSPLGFLRAHWSAVTCIAAQMRCLAEKPHLGVDVSPGGWRGGSGRASLSPIVADVASYLGRRGRCPVPSLP